MTARGLGSMESPDRRGFQNLQRIYLIHGRAGERLGKPAQPRHSPQTGGRHRGEPSLAVYPSSESIERQVSVESRRMSLAVDSVTRSPGPSLASDQCQAAVRRTEYRVLGTGYAWVLRTGYDSVLDSTGCGRYANSQRIQPPPRTRSPSYSTTACPGETPNCGSSNSTRRSSPRTWTSAGAAV